MLQLNEYEEVELDSSRASTFCSNNRCGDFDSVTLKLKYENKEPIKIKLESFECYQNTIGDLMNKQFSQEERQQMTLMHDGSEVKDNEKVSDLLTPA